jgi:hypothetical protein
VEDGVGHGAGVVGRAKAADDGVVGRDDFDDDIAAPPRWSGLGFRGGEGEASTGASSWVSTTPPATWRRGGGRGAHAVARA